MNGVFKECSLGEDRTRLKRVLINLQHRSFFSGFFTHAAEDRPQRRAQHRPRHRQVVGNRLGSGRVGRVNAPNDARTRSDLRLPSLPR